MNTRTIYGRAAALLGAVCLAACLGGTAQAAVKTVLQAHLLGRGDMDGKAQYVLRTYDPYSPQWTSGQKNARIFRIICFNANPGEVYGVLVCRSGNAMVLLGWCRADREGTAGVELDTRKGDYVPFLKAGDTVELWTEYSMVMRGVLE